MIAELFYPRELKDIIRKLELEDNLRHEPLYGFNKIIKLWIFSTVLIVFLSLVFEGLWQGVCLFCFFSVSGHFFILSQTYAYKAYIVGDVHRGKITKIRHHYIQSTSIQCDSESEGKKVWLSRVGQVYESNQGLEIGKEVQYYYSKIHNTPRMPRILSVTQNCCLRKDLMQEGNGA